MHVVCQRDSGEAVNIRSSKELAQCMIAFIVLVHSVWLQEPVLSFDYVSLIPCLSSRDPMFVCTYTIFLKKLLRLGHVTKGTYIPL